MSDFQYTYKKLWDNQSQCELCHHDTCSDVGQRSMYDGDKHMCSRFESKSKEQRDAERAEKERNEEQRRQEAYEEYVKDLSNPGWLL